MTITPEQLAEWRKLADEIPQNPAGDLGKLLQAALAVPALIDEVERLRADLMFAVSKWEDTYWNTCNFCDVPGGYDKDNKDRDGYIYEHLPDCLVTRYGVK